MGGCRHSTRTRERTHTCRWGGGGGGGICTQRAKRSGTPETTLPHTSMAHQKPPFRILVWHTRNHPSAY